MVRNYKRKKESTYSNETLLAAINAVQSKQMSCYKAAEFFGVPRPTIQARVKGTRGAKMHGPGKPTALSKSQEIRIASLLHVMEKTGYPLTKKEIKMWIFEYIQRNGVITPFKNNVPGDDWCKNFFKRNHLSIKKPQSVEVARKRACNPFTVYEYFNLLEKAAHDLDVVDKPGRIYNLDETSFCIDPSKTKVVGQVGYRSTRTTSSPGRDNTTVLLAANSLGEKVPPLIIFQGKYLWSEWIYQNENVKTAYAVSKKGWMETGIFEKYFKDVFLPAIGKDRPVLLVYDGHSTHVDLSVLESAAAANVTILKLPAHSSDVLQPLDCSTMKSMKVNWDAALVNWQRLHAGAKLPKSEFARILTEIWSELNPVVIQNGFRKTGLYPINRFAIPKERFDLLMWSKWENHCAQNQNHHHDILHAPNHCQQQTTVLQNVPSLLTLVLNYINRIPQLVTDNTRTGKTFYKHTVNPKKFKMTIPHKPSKFLKIQNCQILSFKTETISKNEKKKKLHENISFEQLLLKSIARNDPPKASRKRVQKGAEILTSTEVLSELKKQQEIKQCEIEKKNNRKKIKTEKKILNNKKDKNTIKNKSIKKKKSKIIISDTDDTDDFSVMDSSEDEEFTSYRTSIDNDSPERDFEIAKVCDVTSMFKEKEEIKDKETLTETKLPKNEQLQTENNKKQRRSLSKYDISKISQEIKKTVNNKTTSETENMSFTKLFGSHEFISEEEEIDINVFLSSPEKFKLYDWIIVKFATKKTLKHYVGQIIGINDDKPRVKYVRKDKFKRTLFFDYPDYEDVQELIHVEDIISILPEPTISRRGQISFNFDFSVFNVQ